MAHDGSWAGFGIMVPIPRIFEVDFRAVEVALVLVGNLANGSCATMRSVVNAWWEFV